MNRTATVTPSHGPGPGPGPAAGLRLHRAPIPRKLRPGPGERRRGRGARVKRRRRRGSPAPYLGKTAGAIVHFRLNFLYILHSQAPETNRCASRFALTPKKKASAILASARPGRGGAGSAQIPRKVCFGRCQPPGKTKVPGLYDSAVRTLLHEVGLTGSHLDAANNLKSEWHNITRPEALAATVPVLRLARHPGFQPKLPPNGPLLSPT
jgi:hypothetical protein